jgi:drug/metabolite transporter (DMT)-like permease
VVPGASTRDATRGRWLVFGAAFLWGTSATLARFVFRDRHAPALTAVELRLLFSVAILGPWLALRRPQALRIARSDWGYFLVLGLFGVAAVQGTYYYAISVLGVGLAILIQYLAPALIVGYGALRGMRVRVPTIVALVSAILGIALLVSNVDPVSLEAHPPQVRPLHWAVGFGSTLSFAFYVVFSKRGLQRYAPETVLFYTFLVAGVFWAIITPPWRIIAAGYGADLWLMFAALGVFSTLAPFFLFNTGLRHLSAAEAGIIASLEPVVAALALALCVIALVVMMVVAVFWMRKIIRIDM